MGEDQELQAPACSAQCSSSGGRRSRVPGLAPGSRPTAMGSLSAGRNAQRKEDRRSTDSEPQGLVPLTPAVRGPLACWAVGALRAGWAASPHAGPAQPLDRLRCQGTTEPDVTPACRKKGEAGRDAVTSSQDGGERVKKLFPLGGYRSFVSRYQNAVFTPL